MGGATLRLAALCSLPARTAALKSPELVLVGIGASRIDASLTVCRVRNQMKPEFANEAASDLRN